jgi:hypothetical protein
MSENKKIHLTEYKCKECNKTYASQSSLCNHNKKFHAPPSNPVVNMGNHVANHPVTIDNTTVKIEAEEKKYNCRHCNNIYSTKQSRWRHEKSCKKESPIINNNVITTLQNKITELENKLNTHQIVPINPTNHTNSHNVNQTNNGTINNGTINNNSLVINQLGTEKINYKTKDIRRIARDGLNGAITCVQKTNFNRDKPENHSFLTSSLDGQYCTTINHKTQKPEKVPKKDLFWKVLESSFKIIEGIALQIECNSELREQIPVNEQDKLYELIENKSKFYEKKNWKSFYNSINSMSYNYKDLILSTWSMLKVPEIIEESDSDFDSEPDVKEVTEFHDSDSDDDFNLLNAIN